MCWKKEWQKVRIKCKLFLDDLLQQALPKAKEEVKEIKAFIKELGDDIELQRWDWGYYSEKLKKKKYAIDDELLRPYFKLENVLDGVFQSAEKLYDIRFKEVKNIPVYHEDVTTYEVSTTSGEHVAIFYADFHPREGKRGGAWMTTYRDQYRKTEMNSELWFPMFVISPHLHRAILVY